MIGPQRTMRTVQGGQCWVWVGMTCVDVDAAARLGAMPVPTMLSWKTLADSKSLYNTPSVLSIYVTGLVLERMKAQGGVHYYEELNRNSGACYCATHVLACLRN